MALRDPNFGNVAALVVDAFIAGDFPRQTDNVSISAGQNLAAGSVLGEVAATGEFVLSLSAAADGSEVPIAVLQDAVDATAGALNAAVWFTGCFNEDALVYGAAHTKASIKAGLRSRSIFLKPVVGA